MTKNILSLWVCLAVIIIFKSKCVAYDDITHFNIVRDAFEFIIANKSDSTTKYADGSTPKSDYELLIATLSGSSGAATDQVLKKIAERLGNESINTDRILDVTLTLPWYNAYKDLRQLYGISFTTFSHFINVRFPSQLWEHDGYSYRWARQSSECSGNAEDLIANILIEKSNATVNRNKTDPYVNYRNPLKSGISPNDYERQFNLKVEDLYFWPISHLAEYWFESFLKSPKNNAGTPLNLIHIAPVLHAVADATVPFHAVGLSGCGHCAYEARVDGLYTQRNDFYNPMRVKRYLIRTSYLQHTTSIMDIVTKNAEFAADDKFCNCSITNCDCSKLTNADAKELVNLAIASSVLVLRKGLTEWSKLDAQKSAPRVTLSTETLADPTGPGHILRFNSFAEVKFGPPTVVAAEPALAESMAQKLQVPISKLQDAAGKIEVLTVSEINNSFTSAIAELSSVVAKIPQGWDPFKVTVRVGNTIFQDPRIAFRLPTAAELEGEWSSYSRLHNNFYVASSLYHLSVLIGALEGWRSSQRLEPAQIESAEQYAKALRDRQDVLIRALALARGVPVIRSLEAAPLPPS